MYLENFINTVPGCRFEIQNPTVLIPNGDEVQVKGCFRIKEI